jgi:hypothetical protein
MPLVVLRWRDRHIGRRRGRHHDELSLGVARRSERERRHEGNGEKCDLRGNG